MKKQAIPLSLFVFLLFVSLFIGVGNVSVQGMFSLNQQDWMLLMATRIPRTVSLVIAGASLSICGLIMQHLTQNRFVSPTTAGTMDSARLGILIAMLFFQQASILTKSLVAFVFAFLGTMLFLFLLDFLPKRSQIMVPLIGVMYGNVVGALATFLAYQYQLVQNMSSWLQGNFATVTRGGYELIYLNLPLLVIVYLFAYHFTVAGMGEDMASSLGVSYRKVQLLGLALSALCSSVVLTTVGDLPFVGVIIPNIITLFYGDNMQKSLWFTGLFGGIFLLVCDIIARVVIAPYEVPVSLVVGIIGSAVFILLLLKGVGKR